MPVSISGFNSVRPRKENILLPGKLFDNIFLMVPRTTAAARPPLCNEGKAGGRPLARLQSSWAISVIVVVARFMIARTWPYALPSRACGLR
jgi:hypothetical protein